MLFVQIEKGRNDVINIFILVFIHLYITNLLHVHDDLYLLSRAIHQLNCKSATVNFRVVNRGLIQNAQN